MAGHGRVSGGQANLSKRTKYPRGDPALMLDLARAQLSTQLDFADAVDSKGIAFLGWGSAILGLFLAALALRQGVNRGATIFLGPGIAAYGILVWDCLRVVTVSKWYVGPKLP